MPESKPRAQEKMPGPNAEEQRYPIRIGRDGTWFHEGGPIRRMELVRLFAGVLSRDEAGGYWLATPYERGRIEVDDLPFVAVAVEFHNEDGHQALVFRTNLDQTVVAGPDHPLGVDQDPETGEPRPYIGIGRGLEARIARPVFYELVERGERRQDGAGTEVGIWSRGTWFTLGRFTED
ncbi:DUF1285 domain-containing protein [Arenibaculum pallidiluteum]|uniref:DUF1285 domain-containing protein n=1 Tax=Arenibaculum pallidiluteum TaxID=2812559 RepID=UPI002E285FB8|nr:DUF1285 domain-containing protein [Arenibaculum pallidiluteum]